MKGKRLTIRASLQPYIQQVKKAFGLEDDSAAVNLIIGSCSVKPLAWLALTPGETSALPPAVAIEVAVIEAKADQAAERNVLDMLSEDLNLSA